MPAVLQFESVSKYIGELVLFENVNFILNQGEKSAIIGINGAGKTSLLNLIIGKDTPDHGKIQIDNSIRIGYLPQDPEFPPELTVMEALFSAGNESIKSIMDYEESLLKQDIATLEKCTLQMDRLKLWDYENRIKQMLTQLDITQFHQKIAELSGGQLKRVALANTLLNEPDLLLLDEPTNHLDLPVIEWLENYIRRSAVTLLMVTHDRYFLDRICNVMLEIDQHKIVRYDGNYSRFVDQREKRIALEALEVEKAKNQLRKEEDWMSRMPKARGTKAKYRIDNYYQLKEKSGQRREDQAIRINVKETRMGSKILTAKKINFKWDSKYYLKDFNYTFSRFEKIGIVGKNGTGKTTLLEVLTRVIKPESGIIEVGETIKVGYYRQEGMVFDENMKVLDAVTKIAETVAASDGSTITVSQFLNYFLFPYSRQYDYIYKLSGGEKRRLYLCQVLMQNPNFLILDEPTNDLDIASLQVLEEYLSEFNGCVIIVSHDRYFMDSVVDHLFVFSGNAEIKDFPGNYTDYAEWKKESEKSIPVAETKQKEEKLKSKPEKNKLNYSERKELEQLEKEIGQLEKEKIMIESLLNSGTLNQEELHIQSIKIGEVINQIDSKSERWIELSEKL
jgi:ABC transport system ATP-binding/permease protein